MTNDDPMTNCIQLCWECRATCQATLYQYCLVTGGEHIAPEHVKAMTDCIEICQISADFMTRGSHLHMVVCAACAAICEACATSCDHLGDETMTDCADLCRRCAMACDDMGRMAKAA